MRSMHLKFDLSDDTDLLLILRDLAHQMSVRSCEKSSRTAEKVERFLTSELQRIKAGAPMGKMASGSRS